MPTCAKKCFGIGGVVFLQTGYQTINTKAVNEYQYHDHVSLAWAFARCVE